MDTVRDALKGEPTFGDETDPSVLNFIRLLEGSELFIPEADFWKFYELIPSWSRPLPPAQRGRPAKLTESLKAKIWRVVFEGKRRVGAFLVAKIRFRLATINNARPIGAVQAAHHHGSRAFVESGA